MYIHNIMLCLEKMLQCNNAMIINIRTTTVVEEKVMLIVYNNVVCVYTYYSCSNPHVYIKCIVVLVLALHCVVLLFCCCYTRGERDHDEEEMGQSRKASRRKIMKRAPFLKLDPGTNNLCIKKASVFCVGNVLRSKTSHKGSRKAKRFWIEPNQEAARGASSSSCVLLVQEQRHTGKQENNNKYEEKKELL